MSTETVTAADPVKIHPIGHRHYQLVYRQTLHDLEPSVNGDAEVIYARSLSGAMGLIKTYKQAFGLKSAVITMLKLMTSTRQFYAVVEDGVIAHTGWVMLGKCKHYYIEPDAAIIGPIWSAKSARGKGFATLGLFKALSELHQQSISHAYIDTSDDNLPCQRVIEKCGFGPPMALLPRKEEID